MRKIRTVMYRGVKIEVYKWLERDLLFYPTFNGNAEFKTWEGVTSYIRGVLKYEREMDNFTRLYFSRMF